MQDYLRRCLDSLIVPKEQMKHLEVLVVNDGSKDNSSAIAHEYQEKYPDTFRVIDKENGNYGSCINRGLKEATGKYIKILDADDWFDTKGFSQYIAFLANLNVSCDVFFTSYTKQYVEEGTRGIVNPGIAEFGKLYSFSEFNFVEKQCKQMLVMHAITYRTEMLKLNNYQQDTGISYTDLEFDMIPMLYIDSMMFVNINLYQYLLGREGQTVSQSVSSKSLNAYFKIYDTLSCFYEQIARKGCEIRLINARVVFVNLLSSLFGIALYYEAKSPELNDKLCVIKNFMIKVDPILLNELRKTRAYYVIPIFSLWEKFNIFFSSKLVHSVINMIVFIKKRIL